MHDIILNNMTLHYLYNITLYQLNYLIYCYIGYCPTYHLAGPPPKVCKTPILSKGSQNILASPLAPMAHVVCVS